MSNAFPTFSTILVTIAIFFQFGDKSWNFNKIINLFKVKHFKVNQESGAIKHLELKTTPLCPKRQKTFVRASGFTYSSVTAELQLPAPSTSVSHW